MTLHIAIQNAILAEIARPEFNAALPPLSETAWLRIIDPSPGTKNENERLEFLGDAMMYATLGRQLYEQLPDGSPGLYTSIRGALHSNVTFSRLAEKLDIFAVSDFVLRSLTARTFGEGTSAPCKTKGRVKATADLFETVIGSYYLEKGYTPLCKWVNELYRPLIVTARRAYFDNLHVGHNAKLPQPILSKKRVFSPMKSVAILVKPSRLVHKPKVSRKVLAVSSQGLRLPLTPNRTITRRMRAAQKLRAAGAENVQTPATKSRTEPVLIDLTALEDSDADTSLAVDASVSKPNALITNKVMEHLSPEPMDISDDEAQDRPGR